MLLWYDGQSANSVDSPPGPNACDRAFCWEEHWRQRTVRENDEQSVKAMNSSGVKTLEMIPGHPSSKSSADCFYDFLVT
jgi:hypothetical protein